METMMSHWFCHQRARLHCTFFWAIVSGNNVTWHYFHSLRKTVTFSNCTYRTFRWINPENALVDIDVILLLLTFLQPQIIVIYQCQQLFKNSYQLNAFFLLCICNWFIQKNSVDYQWDQVHTNTEVLKIWLADVELQN